MVQKIPPPEPLTGAYTPDATEAPTKTIGRYFVKRVLGKGGFGLV